MFISSFYMIILSYIRWVFFLGTCNFEVGWRYKTVTNCSPSELQWKYYHTLLMSSLRYVFIYFTVKFKKNPCIWRESAYGFLVADMIFLMLENTLISFLAIFRWGNWCHSLTLQVNMNLQPKIDNLTWHTDSKQGQAAGLAVSKGNEIHLPAPLKLFN